ncbi:hypothetical protein RQM47_10120 [Rubrivirga sp. S365]|uniref:DUF3618 domain-containing protein n=1 Tax=Rubrivirga litoralis TaxID=3075598 RepID=A0ABU3BTA6_9BACT|nr:MULTISPECIES: hypothetical protein [unclassified Rubrivirga]MDT0632531.1 hypothetical protein [Rubrivirga sp. F394]MDT7856996.1 hypothetical protein [Rubrivirga sp. S365]
MPEIPDSTPPAGALPSPPVRVPERIDPDHDTRPLPAAEIRARLDARKRDIEYHLEALKHEVTTVSDVTVDGQPLPQAVRDHAETLALAAGGVAVLVGFLRGLRKRSKRKARFDAGAAFERARLDAVLDAAARLVAGRGKDTDRALQTVLRSVPAVYPAPKAARSRRAASAESGVGTVIVQAAAGFVAKTALDLLTQRLTGHEETFSAVADAADDA